MPLVGGNAITFAVWVGAIMFMREQGHYVALLGALTVLAVVGVVDDPRGMTPLTKLGFQIFAAILMTSWGGGASICRWATSWVSGRSNWPTGDPADFVHVWSQ
ncbi:hypothetical protein ACU4GD_15810 [Cupriavidus basilensis]